MQEEVTGKSVALIVDGARMSEQVLEKAINAYLDALKNKQPKIYHGKQSLKQLARQNAGLANIEITEKNIKAFTQVAKKYHVDFALKRTPQRNSPVICYFSKAGMQTPSPQPSRSLPPGSCTGSLPSENGLPLLRSRSGSSTENLTERRSRKRNEVLNCKSKKADPSQYSLCHRRVSLQQSIPSLPSGARRRSFRPAHCHFGGLFCCLLQCAAQLPLHGSAVGNRRCRYATHRRISAKPEHQEIPARHGIRQCPLGHRF